MVDGQLDKPGAARGAEGGEEAVHAVPIRQGVYEAAAERLCGATRVDYAIVNYRAADSPGEKRAKPAGDRVPPAPSPAACHVGAIANGGHKPGKVRRVVLPIGVERRQNPPARDAESNEEGGGLPGVA